ncbi:hypothetical protein CDEN61S_03101 [Castellaniella denitrificans]
MDKLNGPGTQPPVTGSNTATSSPGRIVAARPAALLVVFIRERKVKGTHRSEDAPTQFVPMADTLQNSNVMAVLDPRVDPQRDISHDPVIDDPLAAPAAPEPEPKPAPARTASAGE